MCYDKVIQCEILPQESYTIIRNCPGCSDKMRYRNTNCFRVNANGSQIDVWLIYQCERCKHTYNLRIFERTKAAGIPSQIYQSFLENDRELALEYVNDKQLFSKNKAEIDLESEKYHMRVIKGELTNDFEYIEIANPFELRVRTDRVIADLLGISRSKLKIWINNEVIVYQQNYLGRVTKVKVKGLNS